MIVKISANFEQELCLGMRTLIFGYFFFQILIIKSNQMNPRFWSSLNVVRHWKKAVVIYYDS